MAANPIDFPQKSLELQSSVEGETATVKLFGRLTTEGSQRLKDEVRELIPRVKKITLDLGELNYMDSSGLGSLVSVYISCRKANCELCLLHLNRRVAELLRLTKLEHVFDNCGEYL